MTKPIIRNAVETHVEAAYDLLQRHFPEFCGCEICRVDVLVYALNRLPARYVVGREGSVVTDVNLDKDQNRATIEVAVMDAFRKVSLAPRCPTRARAR